MFFLFSFREQQKAFMLCLSYFFCSSINNFTVKIQLQPQVNKGLTNYLQCNTNLARVLDFCNF